MPIRVFFLSLGERADLSPPSRVEKTPTQTLPSRRRSIFLIQPSGAWVLGIPRPQSSDVEIDRFAQRSYVRTGLKS